MSFLLDTLHPWLVRYALWNTLVILLLALPFSTFFLYLLTVFNHRIHLPRWGRPICCLVFLFGLQWWGGAWLRTQIPLLLADTTTGLMVIVLAYSLAAALFAFGVDPSCGGTSGGGDRWEPMAQPGRASFHQLGQLTRFSFYFILLSATPPLLLTGGEPFNTTHTLASWSFLQLWVNGDWQRAILFALVTSGLVIAVVWVYGRLLDGTAHRPQKQWVYWLAQLALPWCSIVCTALCRWLLIGEGRWPLLGSDLLLFVLTSFLIKPLVKI